MCPICVGGCITLPTCAGPWVSMWVSADPLPGSPTRFPSSRHPWHHPHFSSLHDATSLVKAVGPLVRNHLPIYAITVHNHYGPMPSSPHSHLPCHCYIAHSIAFINLMTPVRYFDLTVPSITPLYIIALYSSPYDLHWLEVKYCECALGCSSPLFALGLLPNIEFDITLFELMTGANWCLW